MLQKMGGGVFLPKLTTTTLQNVAKNGGTSYEIHHSLFQNISRDRKIQSLLQKYILQKKVAKKEGGISTE